MKINIYYGGRGLIEDPTLYVINKIQDVLKEIRVTVGRYNLYEQKNSISMLPNTFKDADAVILAVNVEWYGLGGLMQTFLDSCWLYADKQKLKDLYMFPVIVATTNGERKALENLAGAWELLGGRVCDGICTYVSNHVEFETNQVYASIIEKKAEEIYRIVSHRMPMLPNSINACHVEIPSAGIELTPQESEQLSVYVADDTFVKKQKEDVEMLSQMYKSILGKKKPEENEDLPGGFEKAFKGTNGTVKASCCMVISDIGKNLILDIDGKKIKSWYGEPAGTDITVTAPKDVILKIITGKATFQGAFMSGLVSAKGRLDLIRMLDRLFEF